MATFSSPTTDTATVTNASLSGANRTWDAAVETWNQNVNTWNDPYAPWSSPTRNTGELVTNGKFAGSATGWTLGDGWSYSSGALFTYIGADIVTNGSFTGGTTGWTLTGDWSYNSNNVISNGLHDSILSQTIAAINASTYRLGYTISGNTTSSAGIVSFTGFTGSAALGSNGVNSDDIIASQTGSNKISFNTWHFAIPFAGIIDDVSLKLLGTGTLSQNIGAIAGQTYPIRVTASGTTGSLTVSLGGSDSFNVSAGTSVIYSLLAGGATLSISASTDFNGTVTEVSTANVWATATRN